MARTKGAVAKGVDNTAVRIFLRGYGSLGELPRIVEDCICGALGQEEETRRFKGERILAILNNWIISIRQQYIGRCGIIIFLKVKILSHPNGTRNA